MRPLEGQITLVTGASSGIGAQIAIAMGAAGAKVGVNYPFDKEPADQVVSEITQAGGETIPLQAFVSTASAPGRSRHPSRRVSGRTRRGPPPGAG